MSVTNGSLFSLVRSDFTTKVASTYAVSVTGSGTWGGASNSQFNSTAVGTVLVLPGGGQTEFSICTISGTASATTPIITTASNAAGSYSFNRTDILSGDSNGGYAFILSRGGLNSTYRSAIYLNSSRFILTSLSLYGQTVSMSPFGATGTNNDLLYFNDAYISAGAATSVTLPSGAAWANVKRLTTEPGFVGPTGPTGAGPTGPTGWTGPTGVQGTVIFYGYGVPDGISGNPPYPGITGFGPTGSAPPRTNDFYVNLMTGQLSLLE
jgi:hypothetical protein